MAKGNTAKLLKKFIEGMEEAGASVELFYSRQLNVKPCSGEMLCWTTRLGQCHLDDKMQLLYPKLRDADVLVLATPVYIPLPGEMQNVINRLMPLLDPRRQWVNGRTRLVGFHADVKIKKVVLVATSGWWEKGNFGTVLRIAKEIAKDANVEFAGALLRPHFDYMTEEKAIEIYGAAKKAGHQLASRGRISRSVLETISQPLISKKEWLAKFAYDNQ